MPPPAATHEVLNQPFALADYNLFTGDAALREGVSREGADWASADLEAFGAKLGAADYLELGALANRYPPDFDTHDRYGRRVDLVRFHPAYHELMRVAIEHGLHASPWSEPREGAHVARAARFYMQTEVEAGHGCPITMTFAATPSLRLQPELAEQWLPKIHSRVYDPRNIPVAQKNGATIGMAMTEKQGGSDVRANTTRATPIGDGLYEITGHKFFVSAPMCDAFLVLAQAEGGLTCFLAPRWRPDGTKNGIEFIRLKRKMGNASNASSETEWRGALGCARRPGGPGRRDDHRDGGDDAVRLHGRLLRRHAPRGRRGDRPLPAAQGVRGAADRSADHARRARGPRDRGRGLARAHRCAWRARSTIAATRMRTRWCGWVRRSANIGFASARRCTPTRRWNASAAPA